MPKSTENEIRRRIQASGDPQKIEQLCLDGIQIKTITPNIKKIIETCFNIEYLTINDCELRSLDNFPHLKNLIGLELSDNQLTGEDLYKLGNCPQINFLTLDNNKISSMSYLKHLKKLAQLQILEVHDNEISEEQNYRQAIFEMFSNINIVDCEDRNGHRVEEQNHSEYISNIDDSRLDLLALLQEEQNSNNDEFVRTAVSYLDDSIVHSNNRRNSIETASSPTAKNKDNERDSNDRQEFSQKGIMFIRTGLGTDSDDDEENQDLIRDFKRKFHKKDQ